MSNFYGVEGMTFKFVNPAHSGTVTIIGAPSTVDKATSKGIYLDNLTISISNGSDGSITNATGSGTITATAEKNLSESQKPLREGDQSIDITMTGTNPSPPPPTLTYTTKVEIDDPGQDKVKGK